MEQISDMLLAAGALGAAFYCFVLSRRLRRFNNLEKGVGGAVALLSAQVDHLTRALSAARDSARQSKSHLTEQVAHADAVAKRLELLIASVHDIGQPAQTGLAARPAQAPAPSHQVQTQVQPTGPAGATFMRRPVHEGSER